MSCMTVNLPKREELSLRVVLALPNDSSRGFERMMWSTTAVLLPPLWKRGCSRACCLERVLEIQAMCRIRIFVVSVLPAPDSPDTRMD